jgi:hypothetical protein
VEKLPLFGEPRTELSDLAGNSFREARRRIDPGANRRAAQGQKAKSRLFIFTTASFSHGDGRDTYHSPAGPMLKQQTPQERTRLA